MQESKALSDNLLKLTLKSPPPSSAENPVLQLGLFDQAAPENKSRAMDYINPLDATVVDKSSAQIIGIITTKEKEDHESMVMVTALAPVVGSYVFKTYSNIEEISPTPNWKHYAVFSRELKDLAGRLLDSKVPFSFNGGPFLRPFFENQEKKLLETAARLQQQSKVSPGNKEKSHRRKTKL